MEPIFTVNSPTNREIVLSHDTFWYHIVGDHDIERANLANEETLIQIASVIENPSIILKDKNHEKRNNYYGIRQNPSNNSYQNVKIVTEIIDEKHGEVVTMHYLSKLDASIDGREIIYDQYNPEQE